MDKGYLPTGGPSGSLNIFISQAQFSPGDSFYRALAFVTGGGESFRIAWTPEDIKQWIDQPGDVIVKNGVYGDITIDEKTTTFLTYEANVPEAEKTLYDYNVHSISLIEGAVHQCSVENCLNLWGQPTTFDTYRTVIYPGRCYCLYKTKWGTYLNWVGQSVQDWKVTASFDGAGSDTLTSSEKRNIALPKGCSGDGCKVRIDTIGNLVGRFSIDTPPVQWVPLLVGSEPILTIYTKNQVDTVKIKATEMPWSCFQSTYEGTLNGCLSHAMQCTGKENEAVNRCIYAYRNARDDLLRDRTQEYVNTLINVEDAEWVGGDLVLYEKPNPDTHIPLFGVDLNAAWVGIQFVTGKPEMSCPGNSEAESGDTVTLQGTVKNVGDSVGAFTLYANCGNNYISIAPTTVSNMQPGSSTTYTLKVSGQAIGGEEISQKCVIGAYVTKKPEIKSECAFWHTATPRGGFCEPGIKYCSLDGNQVCDCNSGGTALINCADCAYGCVYDISTAGAKCREQQCRLEGQSCDNANECCQYPVALKCDDGVCKRSQDTPCGLFDIKCWWDKLLQKGDCAGLPIHEWLWCQIKNILGPFILIISVFGFILGGLFSYDFLSKLIKDKKMKWLPVVLAIISGLVVAYLLFTYWWVGVIILILFLILKLAVPVI